MRRVFAVSRSREPEIVGHRHKSCSEEHLGVADRNLRGVDSDGNAPLMHKVAIAIRVVPRKTNLSSLT